MALTKVVSLHSYVSCAHLAHLDRRRHNGHLMKLSLFGILLDFNESPAGDNFYLPAPSIKKKEQRSDVSYSSGLYIDPLLRRKQYVLG